MGTTRRPRKLTSREYSWSGDCHRAHEFEPVMEDSMCHPIRSHRRPGRWRPVYPGGTILSFLCSMLSTIFQSPRWLISVGRKDEARQVLARYHGNGDVNAPLVVLEWQELEAGIKVDGTDKRWCVPLCSAPQTIDARARWDYSKLFNSRGARYRMLVISWMGLCYLFSGIGIL